MKIANLILASVLAITASGGFSASVTKKNYDDLSGNDDVVVDVDLSGISGGADTNAVNDLIGEYDRTNLTGRIDRKRDKTDLNVYRKVKDCWTWTNWNNPEEPLAREAPDDFLALANSPGSDPIFFRNGAWWGAVQFWPNGKVKYSQSDIPPAGTGEYSTTLNFAMFAYDETGTNELFRFGATARRTDPTNETVVAWNETWNEFVRIATTDMVDDSIRRGVASKDGAARPLPRYLHSLRFDDSYPDDAAWYYRYVADPVGLCSARRVGNVLERNYDWLYDNASTFVIEMSEGPGRFASVGVASCGENISEDFVNSGKWSRFYKCLPGRTVDGVNSRGVAINVNVVVTNGVAAWEHHVPGDGRDIDSQWAVRYVLDNAPNAEWAATNLANRVYISASTLKQGFSVHYAILDGDSTWLVEDGQAFRWNGRVALAVTNFRLTYGSSISQFKRNDPYGSGYERYSVLAGEGSSITQVWYTTAYRRGPDGNFPWPSEFAGEIGPDGQKIKCMENEKLQAWAKANIPVGAPEIFPRGVGTWQTVHTSIYDISNLTLRVAVQETDDWYTFQVPMSVGLKVETDPTVPAWAKTANPPVTPSSANPGYAQNADYARSAGTANTATRANSAGTADYAGRADEAAVADEAEFAKYATEATSAGSADNANHAATADNATVASHATTSEDSYAARKVEDSQYHGLSIAPNRNGANDSWVVKDTDHPDGFRLQPTDLSDYYTKSQADTNAAEIANHAISTNSLTTNLTARLAEKRGMADLSFEHLSPKEDMTQVVFTVSSGLSMLSGNYVYIAAVGAWIVDTGSSVRIVRLPSGEFWLTDDMEEVQSDHFSDVPFSGDLIHPSLGAVRFTVRRKTNATLALTEQIESATNGIPEAIALKADKADTFTKYESSTNASAKANEVVSNRVDGLEYLTGGRTAGDTVRAYNELVAKLRGDTLPHGFRLYGATEDFATISNAISFAAAHISGDVRITALEDFRLDGTERWSLLGSRRVVLSGRTADVVLYHTGPASLGFFSNAPRIEGVVSNLTVSATPGMRIANIEMASVKWRGWMRGAAIVGSDFGTIRMTNVDVDADGGKYALDISQGSDGMAFAGCTFRGFHKGAVDFCYNRGNATFTGCRFDGSAVNRKDTVGLVNFQCGGGSAVFDRCEFVNLARTVDGVAVNGPAVADRVPDGSPQGTMTFSNCTFGDSVAYVIAYGDPYRDAAHPSNTSTRIHFNLSGDGNWWKNWDGASGTKMTGFGARYTGVGYLGDAPAKGDVVETPWEGSAAQGTFGSLGRRTALAVARAASTVDTGVREPLKPGMVAVPQYAPLSEIEGTRSMLLNADELLRLKQDRRDMTNFYTKAKADAKLAEKIGGGDVPSFEQDPTATAKANAAIATNEATTNLIERMAGKLDKITGNPSTYFGNYMALNTRVDGLEGTIYQTDDGETYPLSTFNLEYCSINSSYKSNRATAGIVTYGDGGVGFGIAQSKSDFDNGRYSMFYGDGWIGDSFGRYIEIPRDADGTLALVSQIEDATNGLVSATNPAFSNAVLAVQISTNDFAALYELKQAFADLPIDPVTGGISLGALFAALASAVAWLKKNALTDGLETDGTPTDQKLHKFFKESNTLLTATIDARLPYPLNTDGTIKDRAVNVVTSGAFVIPEGFKDLLIRYTGVPASLTFSGTDASIADYGDDLPTETGDYLITVTRIAAAECYIRIIKLEARA